MNIEKMKNEEINYGCCLRLRSGNAGFLVVERSRNHHCGCCLRLRSGNDAFLDTIVEGNPQNSVFKNTFNSENKKEGLICPDKLVFVGFRTWVSRFRGVATKYLQNHLNWYLIETILELIPKPKT